MDKKTIIIITVIATLAILFVGYSTYQYEIGRNEMYYNAGYTTGLLYTQESGNIAYVENGTLKEITVIEVCNNIIQQELNTQK